MEGLKKGVCQPEVRVTQTDTGLADQNGTGTKDEEVRVTQVLPSPKGSAAPRLSAKCKPSPDLPPGATQLCSPGFQRGGSHRVPFTSHGFQDIHVRGFGSRKAGPQSPASAMYPPASHSQAERCASGGRTRTEPTARAALEGGREGGAKGMTAGVAPPPQ